MIVNVEFLVNEAIENVITRLHYQVDKTIFFGYKEVIQEQKRQVERFLLRHCGVEETAFYEVSHKDFESVLRTMRKVLQREYDDNNHVFFDITGGEPLILAAFGVLSGELHAPMHCYDIDSDTLIELNTGAGHGISKVAEKQDIKLDLNKFIEMQGGVINYRLNKALASAEHEDFEELMPKLWKVSDGNADIWNAFSDMLKRYSNTEYGLSVELTQKEVSSYLKESRKLDSPEKLSGLLTECEREGLIWQAVYDGDLSFRYLNGFVKECMLNTGSILELHTYMEEKKNSTDCLVGIHLDWDGYIQRDGREDVLNEVDVLVLHGCVPTFISCKNGQVDKNALYELHTVAEKFGGRHAKKVLVATRELSRTDMQRAKEMKIEVR